jgi:hypothetical protein
LNGFIESQQSTCVVAALAAWIPIKINIDVALAIAMVVVLFDRWAGPTTECIAWPITEALQCVHQTIGGK